MFASPLCVLFIFAILVMNTIPAIPLAQDMKSRGRVTWDSSSVLIVDRFYHIKPLDEMWEYPLHQRH